MPAGPSDDGNASVPTGVDVLSHPPDGDSVEQLSWDDYRPLPDQDYANPQMPPTVKRWRSSLILVTDDEMRAAGLDPERSRTEDEVRAALGWPPETRPSEPTSVTPLEPEEPPAPETPLAVDDLGTWLPQAWIDDWCRPTDEGSGLPAPPVSEYNIWLVRADFGDDAAWERSCAAAAEYDGAPATYRESFLEPVNNSAFDGSSTAELVAGAQKSGYGRPVLVVADRLTMTAPEQTFLAIDLWEEPGRTMRVTPSAVWLLSALVGYEVNFSEVADSADGVFRG